VTVEELLAVRGQLFAAARQHRSVALWNAANAVGRAITAHPDYREPEYPWQRLDFPPVPGVEWA